MSNLSPEVAEHQHCVVGRHRQSTYVHVRELLIDQPSAPEYVEDII